MSGAMLDCAICSTRKWKPLEEAHVEDLRLSGAARLFCESCTRETYWFYSQHSEGAAAPRRMAEPPSRSTLVPSGSEPAVAAQEHQSPMRSMQTERRMATDRRSRARRVHRRVALQVPVRLRVSSAAAQFEEVTRTMNVCRNGIYIQTERPYSKGLPIYVAMNYSAREPGSTQEQRATVVRVDPIPGSTARGIAIQIH
jgi:hypothetical protein